MSVADAISQTDPIPGLETLEQLKTKNKTETQQNLNTEQTITKKKQTAPPAETQKQEKILKNATIEMIKKDLQKQAQIKLKSQSSSQKQQTNNTSNRHRKGSREKIMLHNRFGSLSDSSDGMEYLDAPTPRTNTNRSRSPVQAP